jgi:hypothetical protein
VDGITGAGLDGEKMRGVMRLLPAAVVNLFDDCIIDPTLEEKIAKATHAYAVAYAWAIGRDFSAVDLGRWDRANHEFLCAFADAFEATTTLRGTDGVEEEEAPVPADVGPPAGSTAVKLRPKFHNLLHGPDVVRLHGPLRYLTTGPGEKAHQANIKKPARQQTNRKGELRGQVARAASARYTAETVYLDARTDGMPTIPSWSLVADGATAGPGSTRQPAAELTTGTGRLQCQPSRGGFTLTVSGTALLKLLHAARPGSGPLKATQENIAVFCHSTPPLVTGAGLGLAADKKAATFFLPSFLELLHLNGYSGLEWLASAADAGSDAAAGALQEAEGIPSSAPFVAFLKRLQYGIETVPDSFAVQGVRRTTAR